MSSSVTLISSSSRPRIVSNLSRCAKVALSPKSLKPTTSMSSACWASTARKKLRPMRPKPLIPTRIATKRSPCTRRDCLPEAAVPNVFEPYPSLPDPRALPHPRCPACQRWGLGGEQFGRQARFSVGDAQLAGPAIGHREQPPDSTGDRVLGERRFGELTQLLQAGLPVGQSQLPS